MISGSCGRWVFRPVRPVRRSIFNRSWTACSSRAAARVYSGSSSKAFSLMRGCWKTCSGIIYSKKRCVVHWEKFLEFEQTNDLFSLEEDGLPTWDMVRYLVYLDYMW